VVVGRSESLVLSAPIGTYFGLGMISSHYIWAGLRARYFLDENAAITLGTNLPINGKGGQLDGYELNHERYYSVYGGVEAFIPTKW